MPTPKEMLDHAQREFTMAGMLKEDVDPETKNIKDVVNGMLETLQKLNNPEKTMKAAVGLFIMLTNMKIISPVTDDPAEWANKTDLNKGIALWQNLRDPNLFSEDGGKTYCSAENPKVKKESKRLKQSIITL
jgi:hypothetical protein